MVTEVACLISLFTACSDMLDPRQHGFLADRSCVTQVIHFTEDLSMSLNEKSRSDIIYFDFAKANIVLYADDIELTCTSPP